MIIHKNKSYCDPVLDTELNALSDHAVKNRTLYNAIVSKARAPFNSVADMKASLELTAGEMVCTKGYYGPNDGGHACYYLRTKTNEDVEDNGSIIFISDTNVNLVAELFNIDNGIINVKQFGAKGDGITDDTIAFQNAFNALSNNNFNLFIPQGEYLITSQVNLTDTNNHKIIGSGTILSNLPNNQICFKLKCKNIEINDFHINGRLQDQDQWDYTWENTIVNIGLDLSAENIKVENSLFENIWGYGIRCRAFKNVVVKDTDFFSVGGRWNIEGTGVDHDWFGDSLYFAEREGETQILVDNCKLEGKNTDDDFLSRIGITIENGFWSNPVLNDTKTDLIVKNCSIKNYQRIIHAEANAGVVNIYIDNTYMRGARFCFWYGPGVYMKIEDSKIDYVYKPMGLVLGITGNVSCPPKIEVNNTIINTCYGCIATCEISDVITTKKLDLTYRNCTFNNINKEQLISASKEVRFYDCVFNFLNTMDRYFAYNSEASFYSCTFNNSTTESDLDLHSYQQHADYFYDCTFNNIWFGNNYHMMNSNNVFYCNNTVSDVPHLYHARIVLPDRIASNGLLFLTFPIKENFLKSYVDARGGVEIKSNYNFIAMTKQFPDSKVLNIPFDEALDISNYFSVRKNHKYLFCLRGTTYWFRLAVGDLSAYDFYYSIMRVDNNGDITFDEFKAASKGHGYYDLIIDNVNKTVTSPGTYPSHLNMLILPIEYLSYLEPNVNKTKEFTDTAFTTIGSPTLTTDGILSNITTSNYLKTITTPLKSDSAFEISATFKMSDDEPTNQAIWGVDNLSGWYNYLQVYKNYIAFRMQFSDDTTNTMLYNTSLRKNVEYRVVISWDKSTYKMKIYRHGELLTTLNYQSNLSLKDIDTAKLFIGRSRWGEPIYYLRGSMDLKNFYVMVNGCISLTGKKVI